MDREDEPPGGMPTSGPGDPTAEPAEGRDGDQVDDDEGPLGGQSGDPDDPGEHRIPDPADAGRRVEDRPGDAFGGVERGDGETMEELPVVTGAVDDRQTRGRIGPVTPGHDEGTDVAVSDPPPAHPHEERPGDECDAGRNPRPIGETRGGRHDRDRSVSG